MISLHFSFRIFLLFIYSCLSSLFCLQKQPRQAMAKAPTQTSVPYRFSIINYYNNISKLQSKVLAIQFSVQFQPQTLTLKPTPTPTLTQSILNITLCIYQQQSANSTLNINITSMQEQISEFPINNLLHHLINTNHTNIHQNIISFLGPQEISIIAQSALQLKTPQFFYQITIAQHFLQQFVNRVDRTNYYLFYDEPQFKKIQSQYILNLIAQNYPTLLQQHQSFSQLLDCLQRQLKGLAAGQQIKGIISNIFFQTDLSLPKMKRQTIGMYCQSSLQDYLSLLKFPEQDLEEPWTQQCIIQLKQQSQKELQQLISYFPYYHSPMQQPATTAHEKIRILRFSAFKITHRNWSEYLIQGFRMHNLLVVIFALCSQLVESYHFILDHIQDPFLKFTEFSLRANIYRNLILNFDQKFSFLLQNYTRFYENVYSPPLDRPPFKFWIPALSIWTQTMKVHHKDNNKVYNYVASKMRQASLLEFLKRKTEKLPSFFSNLKDQVEMHMFSESRKAEVYSENDSKVELEYFFQSNEELYEVILKDYLQYMVDISINQFNVHLCGHSRHIIATHPLFTPFKQSIIAESQLFYSFIKDILYESSPQQLRLGFVKEVIKEDLAYSNLKTMKPVILREIIDMINESMSHEVKGMNEFAVFQEEGMAKYRINWEFQETDTLLDYFCGKYGIQECPQKLVYYYNCQFQDTNENQDSDCEESFQQCQEYNSEQQIEQDQ